MSTVLIVVALVAVTALGAWLASLYERRRRARRFRNRQPMSPDVFYEAFYAESGLPKEVVLKILADLERATGIPRTLLRPEDRLWEGESIDDFLYDSLQTVELVIELEEFEKETGQPIEVGSLDTVDRYIRALGMIERQKMMRQRPRKQA